MVQINFAQKQVKAKIVYYGPGMSGKTTNLEVVHQRAPNQNRGDLTSISTDGDRTLFFDFMPLDLGTVAGMKTTFQIYTVPGQVYYNSTRKLVLQGVDGVVFVADSSASMTEQNLESLRNLEENLNEYGKSLATLPHIIQYNKRDLPDALPVEELASMLNEHKTVEIEAVANTGQGVFPTLKSLASLVLKNIMSERGGGRPAPVSTQAPVGTDPSGPAAPISPAMGATGFHQVDKQGNAPEPAVSGAPVMETGSAPVQGVGGPSMGGGGTGAAPVTGTPGNAPAAMTIPGRGGLHETAVRPRPGVSDLMKQQAESVAAAAPSARPRPKSQAAAGAGADAKVQPQIKQSKGGVVFTVGFVVVAAAVGFVIARTILSAV